MRQYHEEADEVFVNVNVTTRSALDTSAENTSRWLACVRQAMPGLRHPVDAPGAGTMISDDPDDGSSWFQVESQRLSWGQSNPASLDAVFLHHATILDALSHESRLEEAGCEAIDVIFGFDFRYQGNHDHLLARALGASGLLGRQVLPEGLAVIDYQPSVTFALDPQALLQARLSTETRTDAGHFRAGEFPDEALSVDFAVRQHFDPEAPVDLPSAFRTLRRHGEDLLSRYVLPGTIRLIREAIASA